MGNKRVSLNVASFLMGVCLFMGIFDCKIIWAREEDGARWGNSVRWGNRIHESEEQADQIQCKDAEGKAIKWYVAYKLAKIPAADNENIRRGIGYVYLTPRATDWILASQSVNDSTSLPARTLDRLFSRKGGSAGEGDFVTVIYNDQPPDLPVMFDNGHTKGVILANENGGIWLQHSVPKFPKIAAAANYSYPWTGAPNGQIFFCMTLTKEQLDSTVANILHVTKPNFYNYSFPKHLLKDYPNLYKLINKKRLSKRGKRTGNRIPMKDDSAVFSMKVDDSVDMTIFAKSPAHHAEVYADWIAPSLKSGLKVQSWLNGPGPLPSNCTLKSLMVKNIMNKTLSGYSFSTHHDHSKWAIGVQADWMCISDLNRMKHQEVRGGATFCFKNPTLWKNFNSGILKVEPCAAGRRFMLNFNEYNSSMWNGVSKQSSYDVAMA